jgi:uncharacterized protein YggE
MHAHARRFIILVGLTTLAAVSRAATAATPAATGAEIPQIAVTGTAEASAPAARGALSIGIEILRPTAAAASEEGARVTQAVMTALHQAGLAPGDIKGTRLTVNAQWSFDDQTHKRRHDGFQAATTLLVDTAALEHLGSYIDAALNAGATTLSDVQYSAADEQQLRREALTRAVHNARGEAEAIAAAAGGGLGDLLQISTEQSGGGTFAPRPMLMSARAVEAPVATSLTPSDIHVAATVTAQWRFVPGVRAGP